MDLMVPQQASLPPRHPAVSLAAPGQGPGPLLLLAAALCVEPRLGSKAPGEGVTSDLPPGARRPQPGRCGHECSGWHGLVWAYPPHSRPARCAPASERGGRAGSPGHGLRLVFLHPTEVGHTVPGEFSSKVTARLQLVLDQPGRWAVLGQIPSRPSRPRSPGKAPLARRGSPSLVHCFKPGPRSEKPDAASLAPLWGRKWAAPTELGTEHLRAGAVGRAWIAHGAVLPGAVDTVSTGLPAQQRLRPALALSPFGSDLLELGSKWTAVPSCARLPPTHPGGIAVDPPGPVNG